MQCTLATPTERRAIMTQPVTSGDMGDERCSMESGSYVASNAIREYCPGASWVALLGRQPRRESLHVHSTCRVGCSGHVYEADYTFQSMICGGVCQDDGRPRACANVSALATTAQGATSRYFAEGGTGEACLSVLSSATWCLPSMTFSAHMYSSACGVNIC